MALRALIIKSEVCSGGAQAQAPSFSNEASRVYRQDGEPGYLLHVTRVLYNLS